MGERRDTVITSSGQGCHHRRAATEECGWRPQEVCGGGTCIPSQEKVNKKLPESLKSVKSALLAGELRADTFPPSGRRNAN